MNPISGTISETIAGTIAGTIAQALPSIVVAVVVFVEAVLRAPLLRHAGDVVRYAARSMQVIRAPRISDHWKERVLPVYAARLLRASLLSAAWLLVIAAAAAVGYVLVGRLFFNDLSAVIESAATWPVQAAALALGTGYAALRRRIGAARATDGSGYSATDRALHRLLLGSRVVKETAFDLECALNRIGVEEASRDGPPVYVAGLARAGTTVLLRALHSSGQFATQTYAAMPMVVAPNLWQRLTGRTRARTELTERAHGDGLLVGSESPEAFEEVFWNTFSAATYIRDDRLEPVDRVPEDVLAKYRRHVANVIHAAGNAHGHKRYLAKNNNNLLRIPVLRAAFADARVIVPFRQPAAHAASLLNQHRRFLQRHAADAFSLRYMDWLSHYEFGAHMKPFAMGEAAALAERLDPLALEYWLAYWTQVHEWVLEHNAGEVLWFDYDAFCADPAGVLDRLADRLGLDHASLADFTAQVRPATVHDAGEHGAGLDRAQQVHRQLVRLAALS